MPKKTRKVLRMNSREYDKFIKKTQKFNEEQVREVASELFSYVHLHPLGSVKNGKGDSDAEAALLGIAEIVRKHIDFAWGRGVLGGKFLAQSGFSGRLSDG